MSGWVVIWSKPHGQNGLDGTSRRLAATLRDCVSWTATSGRKQGMSESLAEHDIVVLIEDVPAEGLRAGDVGVVPPDASWAW
jgi:hypothetical protein